MWIRKQDKLELIKVSRVAVTGKIVHDPMYGIILGEYVSKKRALEVLDDIQRKIITGTTFDRILSGERVTREYVYEMPQS